MHSAHTWDDIHHVPLPPTTTPHTAPPPHTHLYTYTRVPTTATPSLAHTTTATHPTCSVFPATHYLGGGGHTPAHAAATPAPHTHHAWTATGFNAHAQRTPARTVCSLARRSFCAHLRCTALHAPRVLACLTLTTLLGRTDRYLAHLSYRARTSAHRDTCRSTHTATRCMPLRHLRYLFCTHTLLGSLLPACRCCRLSYLLLPRTQLPPPPLPARTCLRALPAAPRLLTHLLLTRHRTACTRTLARAFASFCTCRTLPHCCMRASAHCLCALRACALHCRTAAPHACTACTAAATHTTSAAAFCAPPACATHLAHARTSARARLPPHARLPATARCASRAAHGFICLHHTSPARCLFSCAYTSLTTPAHHACCGYTATSHHTRLFIFRRAAAFCHTAAHTFHTRTCKKHL